VLGAFLPAIAVVCLSHPVELDQEVMRRALPWLPPDLARQVVKHERDFQRGALAATTWPAQFHESGGSQNVEAALAWQCRRVSEGLKNHMPFPEVVAGLGAVVHLTVDLNRPFAVARDGPYSRAFTSYMLSARDRIPLVFYGQDTRYVRARETALGGLLGERRDDMGPLASIVREDLDRVGGPGAWSRLDDRSSTFGSASLVLNHSASDFVNLGSWVWRNGGGLVPDIALADNSILVWKGEVKPREEPSRPVIRIRKTRS
jgi:hypothetical protein